MNLRALACLLVALGASLLVSLPAGATGINALDANRTPFQYKAYQMPDGTLAPGSVHVDPVTGLPYSPTDQPPLPLAAAQDGTDGSSVTPCAGAIGIRGWLSCIVNYFGAPGATACATDTGSCTLNAQMQRLAQRLSSLISALGSPMQAGTPVQLTPLVVAPTDCGGTITAGGTAQNAAAVDTSRKTMLIENPVSATEDLYVAVSGSATVGGAGNYADLAAGGSTNVMFGGTVIQTAVSVNATSTGHRWLCTYTH